MKTEAAFLKPETHEVKELLAEIAEERHKHLIINLNADSQNFIIF
jgi:hypothetical protein